jgi:O-antigen/teichoic acid export membrane protein
MLKKEEKPGTVLAGVKESKKFASDIIWISVASLFMTMILGIVTLPALTKTYSSEVFGIWINVNVTVGLVSPLISLQLGLAVVKFLAGVEDRIKRQRALGSMLSAIILFSLIVCCAGIALSNQLSVLLFGDSNYASYVNLTIAWTFFNSIYNFLQSYWRVRERIRDVSIAAVSLTVLKMLFIIGLARSGAGMEAIVLWMVILQAAITAGMLALIVREIGFPLPNFTRIKEFLSFSIPQMPVVVLLWVVSLSDRYFITHFWGLSYNGVYSSSNTLAGLTTIFYTPISFVLFPLVARLWAQKRIDDLRVYFEYSVKLFLTLAIPGAAGIAMLSQPLLGILTTSEYLVGEGLVLVVALGIVSLGIYQIVVNVLLLDKQAKAVPFITAIASITSVAINVILIPRIGIMGAAISNCISYSLLATVTMLWARKTIIYNISLKYILKVITSSAVMATGLYFLKMEGIGGLIISVIAGAAVFAASLFLTKAFSSQELQMAKKILSGFIPANLIK